MWVSTWLRFIPSWDPPVLTGPPPPDPPSLSAPSDLEAPAEQGQCFRIVSESRGCEHALPTYLTQVMCCCTVGKAWGPNCEPCPQTGTGEHGEAGRRSRQDLCQLLLFSLKCSFKARFNIFFYSNELFLPSACGAQWPSVRSVLQEKVTFYKT